MSKKCLIMRAENKTDRKNRLLQACNIQIHWIEEEKLLDNQKQ